MKHQGLATHKRYKISLPVECGDNEGEGTLISQLQLVAGKLEDGKGLDLPGDKI